MFSCGTCGSEHEDYKALNSHVQRQHVMLFYTYLEQLGQGQVYELRRSPAGLFDCVPSCSYSNVDPWLLRSHARYCSKVVEAARANALPWPLVERPMFHHGKLFQPRTDEGIDSYGRPRPYEMGPDATTPTSTAAVLVPSPSLAFKSSRPSAAALPGSSAASGPATSTRPAPSPSRRTTKPAKRKKARKPAKESGKIYLCFDCNETFASSRMRMVHRRLQHWLLFHCRIQGQVYQVPRSESGRFECAGVGCGKGWADPYSLKTHTAVCLKFDAARLDGSLSWEVVPGSFQKDGKLLQPSADSRSGSAWENKQIWAAKAKEQAEAPINTPANASTSVISKFLFDDDSDEFSSVGGESEVSHSDSGESEVSNGRDGGEPEVFNSEDDLNNSGRSDDVDDDGDFGGSDGDDADTGHPSTTPGRLKLHPYGARNLGARLSSTSRGASSSPDLPLADTQPDRLPSFKKRTSAASAPAATSTLNAEAGPGPSSTAAARADAPSRQKDPLPPAVPPPLTPRDELPMRSVRVSQPAPIVHHQVVVLSSGSEAEDDRPALATHAFRPAPSSASAYARGSAHIEGPAREGRTLQEWIPGVGKSAGGSRPTSRFSSLADSDPTPPPSIRGPELMPRKGWPAADRRTSSTYHSALADRPHTLSAMASSAPSTNSQQPPEELSGMDGWSLTAPAGPEKRPVSRAIDEREAEAAAWKRQRHEEADRLTQGERERDRRWGAPSVSWQAEPANAGGDPWAAKQRPPPMASAYARPPSSSSYGPPVPTRAPPRDPRLAEYDAHPSSSPYGRPAYGGPDRFSASQQAWASSDALPQSPRRPSDSRRPPASTGYHTSTAASAAMSAWDDRHSSAWR